MRGRAPAPPDFPRGHRTAECGRRHDALSGRRLEPPRAADLARRPPALGPGRRAAPRPIRPPGSAVKSRISTNSASVGLSKRQLMARTFVTDAGAGAQRLSLASVAGL